MDINNSVDIDFQREINVRNKTIDDLKIMLFCELNNMAIRPILCRELETKFTIEEIESVFDRVAGKLKERDEIEPKYQTSQSH